MENNISITTLHNLLDFDAGNLMSAEIHLRNSLSEWINRTNSLKLKAVLQRYLEFTGNHIQKLEAFFEDEQISSLAISNSIMDALITTTEEKLSYCTDPEVKDASLLASIQLINHFKICSYGTAFAFARILEMNSYESIFREMEINEKHIDDRLTQLAEFEINKKAKAPISLP